MCDCDDGPYVPNEFTRTIPWSVWRKLNIGVPMTEPRDPLLTEREKTHGSFVLNAKISQHLKTAFITSYQINGDAHPTCWYELKDVHKEALDMIALKLSRILSGQANFKDHWDDIAGYAKLASEACDK